MQNILFKYYCTEIFLLIFNDLKVISFIVIYTNYLTNNYYSTLFSRDFLYKHI